MKKYKNLNLTKIRDKYGLHFAHYTYLRGMDPSKTNLRKDFPIKCYNKDEDFDYIFTHEPNDYLPFYYLIFVNADNINTHVTLEDNIDSSNGIIKVDWNFPFYLMPWVCHDLQEQLGEGYIVLAPKREGSYIIIISAKDVDLYYKYFNSEWELCNRYCIMTKDGNKAYTYMSDDKAKLLINKSEDINKLIFNGLFYNFIRDDDVNLIIPSQVKSIKLTSKHFIERKVQRMFNNCVGGECFDCRYYNQCNSIHKSTLIDIMHHAYTEKKYNKI